MTITVNLGPFHSDKAALHHLLQFRQEGVDFLGFVHDLNDNWQIKRKSQDMCVMEVSRPSETHWTTQNGCAGEMKFSCSQDNCSVEWSMHVFISLPKEYSQKRTFFWQIPGLWDWRRPCRGEIFSWLDHHEVKNHPSVSSLCLEEKTIDNFMQCP